MNIHEQYEPAAHREPYQTILVVGGGVAGIHAALEAVALGHEVILVEDKLAIGGHMAQLDKTFPTQDCSLCTLSPRLYDVARNPNIHLVTRARVDTVTGCAGRFRVGITQRPSYVDPDKCIGCGLCHGACPVRIPDTFNLEKSCTKAIRALYPQAVPTTHVIDSTNCLYFRSKLKSKKKRGACRRCEKACPSGAIDFEQRPRQMTYEVGAIILAGGFSMLGPESLADPGWLEFPNVITNLEMERYLSSTGPTQGKLIAAGSEQVPKRIVFVQCMGSRDPRHGVGYCSSVCCSASLKQATLLAGYEDVEEITICYLDLRTHGRECESFLRRVQRIDKVRFVNGKVGAIHRDPDSFVLHLDGTENGRRWCADADLVVLAMGIRAHDKAVRVAKLLGVQLDHFGFVETKTHHPTATHIDGVYACGTLIGPKSIPSTVQEASAAAFRASQRLLVKEAEVRSNKPRVDSTPRDTVPATPIPAAATEKPRIGVFVCRCGTNIAGVLDTKALADEAGSGHNVVWAGEQLFTCSTDATTNMAAIIQEKQLNRVVVASCSPRTHLAIFREVVQKAGLSPSQVVMANIREQCAWVHREEPVAAQNKARALIRQAIDRAAATFPVPFLDIPIKQRALILGGELAALAAATHLADAGVSCVLVCRQQELGGELRHAFYDPKKLDCRKLQRLFLHRVEAHPRIRIFKNTELLEAEGRCGCFSITLKQRDQESGFVSEHQIEVGAILVAIGAQSLQPFGLFGYGESPQILTQSELARQLGSFSLDWQKVNRVAMIQCVGSRNEKRPYCSRSCCQQAVVHALELKKRFPHLHITILYRDLRTYGVTERLYEKARERGIQFLRYQEQAPPEVSLKRFGRSTYVDLDWTYPHDATPFHLRVDRLVLSTATIPMPMADRIASVLHLPLTAEGFFLEKHIKLAPIETNVEGIFIAGQCHHPSTLAESLVQGEAAAAKMVALLRQKAIKKLALVAHINPARCSRCLTCFTVCPIHAVRIPGSGGRLWIDPAVCHGCGICAAECPAGAIEVAGAEEGPLRKSACLLVE